MTEMNARTTLPKIKVWPLLSLVVTLIDARIVGLTVNLFDILAHARWRVRREETLTG